MSAAASRSSSGDIGRERRAASPRANRLAMPCDSDQMCSAIIMAGGRLAAGMPATSASQAPRSTAKARSPASLSSRCSASGEPGLEHGGEIGGLAAREGEVGLAQPVEGCTRIGPALVPGGRKLLLEALEAAPRHVGHQGVAVAEMAVGRRRADAGVARGLGEGETCGPFLADQVEGGLDQGLPQVAVMVAAPPAAAVPVPAHGPGNLAQARRQRDQVSGSRFQVAGMPTLRKPASLKPKTWSQRAPESKNAPSACLTLVRVCAAKAAQRPAEDKSPGPAGRLAGAAKQAAAQYEKLHRSCHHPLPAGARRLLDDGHHQSNTREWAVWDERLNHVYNEALKGAQPKLATALRDAQRTWLQWRERRCRLPGIDNEGGWIVGPLTRAACSTRQRARRSGWSIEVRRGAAARPALWPPSRRSRISLAWLFLSFDFVIHRRCCAAISLPRRCDRAGRQTGAAAPHGTRRWHFACPSGVSAGSSGTRRRRPNRRRASPFQ